MLYFFGITDSIQRNNIVKTGLQLNLDAANTSSYSGSGNTWYDLTNNGYNATLINSPSFNSANGGSILFNGTNQYADLGTPTLINNIPVVTACIWVKFVSVNASVNAITLYSKGYNNINEGFVFRVANANPGFVYTGSYSNSSGNNGITTLTPVNTGIWYNIVAQYSGIAWSIYINGILSITSTNSIGPQNSTSKILIAALDDRNNIVRYLNGYVSVMQIYNISLTQSQIKQNFNALCTRYGYTPIP